jgi:hypothetical protein
MKELISSKAKDAASLSLTKNCYRELLDYYYETGIGNKSRHTGTVISAKLIAVIEDRHRQIIDKQEAHRETRGRPKKRRK